MLQKKQKKTATHINLVFNLYRIIPFLNTHTLSSAIFIHRSIPGTSEERAAPSLDLLDVLESSFPVGIYFYYVVNSQGAKSMEYDDCRYWTWPTTVVQHALKG